MKRISIRVLKDYSAATSSEILRIDVLGTRQAHVSLALNRSSKLNVAGKPLNDYTVGLQNPKGVEFSAVTFVDAASLSNAFRQLADFVDQFAYEGHVTAPAVFNSNGAKT